LAGAHETAGVADRRRRRLRPAVARGVPRLPARKATGGGWDCGSGDVAGRVDCSDYLSFPPFFVADRSRKITMKKIISGITLRILAALLIALSVPTAHAGARADIPGLQIGTIGYNARGGDSWHNRNAEFVDNANTSDKPVNVYGLRVKDSWAHRM